MTQEQLKPLFNQQVTAVIFDRKNGLEQTLHGTILMTYVTSLTEQEFVFVDNRKTYLSNQIIKAKIGWD